MHDTRLYFSSQMMKDGTIYVAGGEYGTGGAKSERYDPVTNIWTQNPNPGATVSDANSEILPDGRILQALVSGSLKSTILFNHATNTYSPGPSCNGIHNESQWVKLPDNSILFVDRSSTTSERYIPATNTWVVDANLPVSLYDPYGDETGSGFLLPDGRVFYLGATGHTAYYTPSGTVASGTWAAGPNIPGNNGTPDAPGSMMPNGKILCCASPTPIPANHFQSPTYFYEFNYLTNTFTSIGAPGGGPSVNLPTYVFAMLNLPDGSIMLSVQGLPQYFIYTPSGTQ
jgi:hypothetical protein